MGKWFFACIALLVARPMLSQQASLPPDLRQHNLLAVSPYIFNPVFSLEQTTRHEVALWSRWQWQTIDGNPTTVLADYSVNFGSIAAGTGFFQNNIYHFQQTGWMFNLAYQIPINDRARIDLGANFFGYVQELSDNRLIIDEPILPFSDDTRDFIWRLNPAVQFSYDRFGASLVFENLPDYSFDARGAATPYGDKTYLMMGHYTFEVGSGDGATLKPIVYFKKIPGFDSQVGVTALYNADRYWLQGGYNSFYGPSLGAGARLFQHVSLGGLVEFGEAKDPGASSTTFEVFASYRFGAMDRRQQVVGFEDAVEKEIREEAEMAEAARLARENARRDSLQTELALEESRKRDSIDAVARNAERVREQQRNEAALLALAEARRRDSLAALQAREQQENEAALLAEADAKRRDSLAAATRAAELARAQRVEDSLARARVAAAGEEVKPLAGEVYQEVSAEEGLEPGFYLIANVFGTQRYRDAFLRELQAKGFEPGHFYRAANKFNYVYLGRYATISEARRARDSHFDGKYTGDLWIFRVR